MKNSPRNKMMNSEDMQTKSQPFQSASGQPVVVGATIPFEGQHQKQMFWVPQYRRSVEAESLEEAIQIAKEDSLKQS